MRAALNRSSNRRRTRSRSRRAACSTAAAASSTEPTTSPVTPWSTTSGTEPFGHAMTGVPHDIDSIIARPKGSGQSIGNSSAVALPRKAGLRTSSSSPMNSTDSPSISGAMRSRQWRSSGPRSIFAAMRRRMPARRAIAMARSSPFSGDTRPRKAR